MAEIDGVIEPHPGEFTTKRAIELGMDLNRCQQCGCEGPCEAHLFGEVIPNLEVLCPTCLVKRMVSKPPAEPSLTSIKREEKLILLGNGPSKMQCPFFKDVKVWVAASVLGSNGFRDREYSKVFCFDNPALKPDERVGLDVAKEKGLTVVGFSRFLPDVTEEYPLGIIQRAFGTTFFLNDLSYMIALAVHKAYKALFLYGVDQSGPIDSTGKDLDGKAFDYRNGRAYVAFWLGAAVGRGIHYQISSMAEPWMRNSRIGGY